MNDNAAERKLAAELLAAKTLHENSFDSPANAVPWEELDRAQQDDLQIGPGVELYG